MKTLLLLRHAKTEKDTILNDFNRQLTEKGKEQAIEVGKKLAKIITPNLILASAAKRTKKTAKLIAQQLNYNEANIELDGQIYNASLSDLANVIRDIDDEFDKVIVVAHNPAVTSIIEHLTAVNIQHLRPAEYAVIELDIATWKTLNTNCGKLIS